MIDSRLAYPRVLDCDSFPLGWIKRRQIIPMVGGIPIVIGNAVILPFTNMADGVLSPSIQVIMAGWPMLELDLPCGSSADLTDLCGGLVVTPREVKQKNGSASIFLEFATVEAIPS